MAVPGVDTATHSSCGVSFRNSPPVCHRMEEYTMTCLECGGKMKIGTENYKYDASGLPGITLVDVEVARCAECGEIEVTIPNIEGLHRALAMAISHKRERV